MNWDKQTFGSHQVIDMEPPPSIGDHAVLTKNRNEFRIEIISIDGDLFKGIVRSIGPTPDIEAEGIHRQETVSFNRTDIRSLHRQAGT